jgi:Glycosyl hydrolases family 17
MYPRCPGWVTESPRTPSPTKAWKSKSRIRNLTYNDESPPAAPIKVTAGIQTHANKSQQSTQNAYTFYQSGICGMLDWGVDVFYFEAFDEPGKQVTTGTDGKPADERHWGAFNTDRSAKFDLTCGGQ